MIFEWDMTTVVKCLQEFLGYLIFSHNKTLDIYILASIVTYFLQSSPHKKVVLSAWRWEISKEKSAYINDCIQKGL